MRLLFTLMLVSVFFSPIMVKGQGNLLIIPRRVVFEGTKRTQELSLANTGTDSAKFAVSIIEYRMEKDGNFKQITEPDSGQYFADKFIRLFPRSVTLAPNEAQIVRLQLVNTTQLKPGEYRSHIYFRALPKALPPSSIKRDTTAASKEISIRLTPQFGISIPVIIRVGASTTTSSLTDVHIDKAEEQPIVHMQINRTGNMSIYGDIKVNYISESGAATQIGLVKGLSVYTPNTLRSVDVKLDAKPGVNLHKGKLQITYAAQPDAKPMKFAEAELQLK